jgi:3-phosphoshikimate 1-carboxyvinyltransferase
MDRVEYIKSAPGGMVNAPPSKSYLHRAIIASALSDGVSTIHGAKTASDINASLSFVRGIGKESSYDSSSHALTISGRIDPEKMTVDCAGSATTLRMLLPIAAALGKGAVFKADDILSHRPLGIYFDLLPEHGIVFSDNSFPLEISGKLTGGRYSLRGDISSQFISGLLFALPLIDDDSEIILTTPLQSAGYVDMTLNVLAEFGIEIDRTPDGFYVRGGQKYSPADYYVEGDWSQAAFFLSMGAVSENQIAVKGLDVQSLQRDHTCVDILRKMGAECESFKDIIKISNPNYHKRYCGLKAVDIDASDIPDIIPPLAVICSVAEGDSRIYNASRLRLKESDRLSSLCDGINAIGGNAEVVDDELIIHGTENLNGGEVDGRNDHRIVMAFAAASLVTRGTVTVSDCYSIKKSYPEFFRDYKKIGGRFNVFSVGKQHKNISLW